MNVKKTSFVVQRSSRRLPACPSEWGVQSLTASVCVQSGAMVYSDGTIDILHPTSGIRSHLAVSVGNRTDTSRTLFRTRLLRKGRDATLCTI